MPTVTRHVEPLDVEEISFYEMPVKTKVETDKSAKSFSQPKVRIEIDPSKHQPEPEYFLEKWLPEHCQLLNRFSRQSKPDIENNSSTQYASQSNKTTIPKPVSRQNNQVKKQINKTSIKAFNLQYWEISVARDG